jgi:maltooligosyltrehalose trehalohydrolase
VLREIGERVRAAARGRGTWIVNENEPQDVRLVRPVEAGGRGLDAIWNDDFHHAATVALTGRNEAYYSDYRGTPQELVAAARHGFLFQGQRHRWQGKRRGTPTRGLPPASLVSFLQNHDQVANSGRGLRIAALAAPARLRAMTALWLLMPQTPMLFQGQEFAASAPFLYFADHKPELAARVAEGRARFLAQFPSLADPAMQPCLADPGSEAAFRRCKLDAEERFRPGHAETLALHRDLVRLRREDAAFRAAQVDASRLDGAVLGAEALLLRYFGEAGDDRLLLVNLGRDLHLYPAPEPLLAPPEGRAWRLLWSSEDPRYGGGGTPAPEDDAGWHLPGQAALVMAPLPIEEEHDG